MSTGSNGVRRIATLLRPSTLDSAVCRSCQETLGRRHYAVAAAESQKGASSQPPLSSGSPEPTPAATNPDLKPTFTIKAGVVVSRPPVITRDLTAFEKAFFLYQRRLNERLALPFTKYFYFKKGTPADEDWKRKIRERQTPARDIGKYNAYSKEAWNDELLVGAVESEPEHQMEMLLRDAETTTSNAAEDSTKEEIQRPAPRVTEADKTGDERSLNRLLQRTLYLVVQSNEGYWTFPSSPVGLQENLRTAAERTLAESAGVNMNTWFVGHHPIGHHVYNFRKPRQDPASKKQLLVGEKTFFMKCRIMAGQADLTANTQNLKDFKWLAKEEIAKYVLPQYYSSIKNMLSER